MSRIYRSSQPPVSIPERSIFTQVFSRKWDPSFSAYTDAPTGQVLTYAEVYTRSLQFAWGLQNILDQKRGCTMAIYSPNSIAWPVLLLGGVAAGLRITTVNSSYTPRELLHQLAVRLY
ncbi:MAG TPA: AMP-binding protein [Chlamydiales bacterium]|jgi:acyl-CoA synthetase (AMP-forming)/AMP-acid ligase II|nr:AMP-binding protein [Chlamydiales bacterium]